MKFNREEGLTLIELLITIAVIAIVAAISIPVITNVIDSSRTSAAESMQAQVNAFVDRYAEAGDLDYNEETQTFSGSVDLDGNGDFGANEVIETFEVDDTQFSVTVNADDTYTVAAGAAAISESAAQPVTLYVSDGDFSTTSQFNGDSGAFELEFGTYQEAQAAANTTFIKGQTITAYDSTNTLIYQGAIAYVEDLSAMNSVRVGVVTPYTNGKTPVYRIELS